MSGELEGAVKNLLAQWEYLRYVPSQALEAVRAAAQVPLSDVAAAAARALADEIADATRSGKRLSHEHLNVWVLLELILGGSIEVRRRENPAFGRPVDGFMFRKPPDRTAPRKKTRDSPGT